jgi:hypothetical protein
MNKPSQSYRSSNNNFIVDNWKEAIPLEYGCNKEGGLSIV